MGVDDHPVGRITCARMLYLVIMKSINMKDSEMKLPEIAQLGDMERDEKGRLYLKRFRELFDPLHVEISAIEALASLRLAARSLHLLQERWGAMHGLSEGRMGVLFRLFRCGDMPLGELADDLSMTPRNVTGLVDHLERDGLVTRVPDAEDRRSIRASLTSTGRARIEAIWKEGLDHQSEVVKGMTKDDLAQLRHLSLVLVDNARKELGK
ncbi:MAG: MarR family transcriptional regulator [Chloroflexi bacterium]|nr:MAG: MarR family transcriptional regulator [Chloroflexota bacterium]TME06043.1 MAG: MarR family transcriptional regulator [Chloroflexota bacterium]TME37571.1 MAG: MarR family transcriptional regulator [Chloroflexota bacterium]TME50155.1 MAG: MarR family transcriptional regulator [Chloroflexota bacterium]